jgi:hypothetical protein
MKSTFHRLLIAVLSLIFALLPGFASGQDAAIQVRTDIQRLQQTLNENPAAPDSEFASLNSTTADLLHAATQAIDHQQLYLALEKLAQATDLLHGLKSAKDNAEVLKAGLPAFESRWGKASLELTALDKQAREREWSGIPAAVRALSESAQGKAIPLLEAGRGFATSTKPQDGLFYLGQAKGEAEFAKFCASLKVASDRTPLALRSFLPELQTLQQKTNDAFHPPRSIELHPRFIALNSTLKLAEELDASRFYAGALYEYLEAVRHFAMLDAALPDSAVKSELKKSIADHQRKLAASQSDD